MAAMACQSAARISTTSYLPSDKATTSRVSLQKPFQVASFTGLRLDACTGAQPCRLTMAAPSFVRKSSLTVNAAVAAPPIPKQKIRIKLRSYWVPQIEQASTQILEAARNSGSETMGPVRLPTKRRLYCVLRSPHVDKDSREHFQLQVFKRLIDLENPNAQTIDALMQLDLPAGVDVEVKLF